MYSSRLLEILFMLTETKRVTASQLATHFNVSVRTIYRDVDALSASGVPIYATTGRKGGIHLMDNFILNKLLLTESEQKEILLGLQTIKAVPIIEDSGVMRKIGQLFQLNDSWIDVDFSRWGNHDSDKLKFNQIKQSILENKTLSFIYISSSGDKKYRTINPSKLRYKHKDWYLYGYCHDKRDHRLFKITRITQLNIQSKIFEQDDNKATAPHVINDDWTENKASIKLLFPNEVAYRVYDVFQESLITQEQNGLVVTAELEFDEWLYSYLLSFGPNVTVISPQCVREELVRRHKLSIHQLETYI